jgi:hypothetical protein
VAGGGHRARSQGGAVAAADGHGTENQDALDTFCTDDLAPAGIDYPYRVVDGNDPRRIDVAICSRLPVRRISSWRFWPDPAGAPVFSRDLLHACFRPYVCAGM